MKASKKKTSTAVSGCSSSCHVWFWAGTGDISKGTPCNCGMVKYGERDKEYNYCPYCGERLK